MKGRNNINPVMLFMTTLVTLSVMVVFIQPAFAERQFNWRKYAGAEIRFLVETIVQWAVVRPLLPEFEKLTGIKVILEDYIHAQVRQKTLIELAAKTPTLDGFLTLPMQDGKKYWKAGYIEPLDDYINNPELTNPDFDWNDFLEGPREICKLYFDGQIGCIPFSPQTHLLFYRKDLFAKYGVKVPETLEEMEEAAKKLTLDTDGDGKTDIYGIVLRGKRQAAVTQLSYYLYNFGGTWLDKEGNPAINRPEAVKAIDFYGRMLRLYGPPGVINFDIFEAMGFFMEGRAAMFTDINTLMASIEDTQKSKVVGKVGYSLIPKGPAGRVPMLPVGAFFISKFSKQKEATWYFIQWVTGKDMLLRIQLSGSASPRLSSWMDPKYKAVDKHPDWSQAVMEGTKLGKPWNLPPVTAVAEARDIIGMAIVDSLLGKDVKAACDKAASEWKKVLEKTEK